MTGKTILVVDDSKVSRMMISSIINDIDNSIEVLEAENANDALNKVKDNSIDFFSVDLNMPGMDGLELISKLQPDYPHAKYSLLTANIQDSTKQKCDDLQIAFTNKPITEDSISQMLEYFNG